MAFDQPGGGKRPLLAAVGGLWTTDRIHSLDHQTLDRTLAERDREVLEAAQDYA